MNGRECGLSFLDPTRIGPILRSKLLHGETVYFLQFFMTDTEVSLRSKLSLRKHVIAGKQCTIFGVLLPK